MNSRKLSSLALGVDKFKLYLNIFVHGRQEDTAVLINYNVKGSQLELCYSDHADTESYVENFKALQPHLSFNFLFNRTIKHWFSILNFCICFPLDFQSVCICKYYLKSTISVVKMTNLLFK